MYQISLMVIFLSVGSSMNLISSGSDYGPFPSGNEINEIVHGGSELFGC